MTPINTASDYEKCIRPYVFDRIEVCANVFTQPVKNNCHQAVFQTPTEPLRFSLLGAFQCDYPSGPHLGALAHTAQEICGRNGFFGTTSRRKLGLGA